MKKIIIVLASWMLLFPMTGLAQPKDGVIKTEDPKLDTKTIRVLPISIISYSEYNKKYNENLPELNSGADLSGYNTINAILGKSYGRIVPYNLGQDGGIIKAESVKRQLNTLMEDVNDKDVVLIHILAHGKIINGQYHLVCSDETLSEIIIREKFLKMAQKGALVIIFLNTCHSGALFEEKGYYDMGNKGGAIVFYASSGYNEKSHETTIQETDFTKRITSALSLNEGVLNDSGVITFGKLKDFLEKHCNPKPVILFSPKKYKNYDLGLYPIMNVVDKKHGPTGPYDGPEPPVIKNNRFYSGIAIGTNHTPTPFGDINIGFDLKNIRVEAGASFAFTPSEDMYIYNTNGILQNAYNYRGYNFYGRIGYDVMSCFKEKSRWELVPLVGISGNYISGKQQDGFNSDIGKDATSLMLSANCRFAYDLTNKGRFFLQGTLGYDFALDNNTKVLGESKYIKNWCKSRPNIEIGLIFKTKLF